MGLLKPKARSAGGLSASAREDWTSSGIDSTLIFASSQPLAFATNSTLSSALAWLDRGAALVPVQPGGKFQVAGFGAHCRKITTPDEASFWFGARSANLALVTGIGDFLALDFDAWRDFALFASRHPDLAETLTEQSRRGVHLYLKVANAGRVRSCASPDGFEVKAAGGTVLVAPSCVGGIFYTTVTRAPVMRCDDLADRLSLSLLSESEPMQHLEGEVNGDTVSRCKAALDVLGLAQDLQRARGLPVVWTHSPDGTWWRSCCPFHGPEQHPSFQVNVVKRFYLCKACDAKGDAINLYQMVHNLPDVRAAISEVAKGLPRL
jgi:hypothetical protein